MDNTTITRATVMLTLNSSDHGIASESWVYTITADEKNVRALRPYVHSGLDYLLERLARFPVGTWAIYKPEDDEGDDES